MDEQLIMAAGQTRVCGQQGRLKSPLGFGRISHPCTGDVWGHFHRERVLELSAAPSRGNPALFPTTSYSWQLPSY